MVLDKYKLLELVMTGIKNTPVAVVSILMSPDVYADILDEIMVWKGDNSVATKYAVDIKLDPHLPGGSIILVMSDGSLKILTPVSLI